VSSEAEVAALAAKVAEAQARVTELRNKEGKADAFDEAKAKWNDAVEAYDRAVDAWAEAGFPKGE
jgi:hypothetical protein